MAICVSKCHERQQLLCLATGADAFPRFTFLAQTSASGFHLELVKIGLRVVWAVTAKVAKVVISWFDKVSKSLPRFHLVCL
jgi:hypothetical protein